MFRAKSISSNRLKLVLTLLILANPNVGDRALMQHALRQNDAGSEIDDDELARLGTVEEEVAIRDELDGRED